LVSQSLVFEPTDCLKGREKQNSPPLSSLSII
jgi:hypothetical protein